MRVMIFVVLLAAFLSPKSAVAGAMSGNELFEACSYQPNGNLREAIKATKCVNYITGVSDTLNFFQDFNSVGTAICIPKGVGIGQMQDVAKKYLRENPAERNYSAGSIVLRAWLRAFPCPKP